MRHLPALALMVVALAGCGDEAPPTSPTARCQSAIGKLATCYPDLAQEAICNDQTVAEFERLGLDQKTCAAIEDDGKSDRFSVGACAARTHRCGWLFCCDDYVITWFPKSEEDWNVVGVVDGFQAAAPADVKGAFDRASASDLRTGLSRSFLQQVVEYPAKAPVEMAVEKTALLVALPFDTFVGRLRPQDWGVKLAHYLGGEVKVYQKDSSGRATRQLERMVLSPFPCDWESALSNNDMTKTEVIQYATGRAKIFWRVGFSNNHSTETDVGSVEFRAYDAQSTLVTFHSAHRLSAPGGIHIPNSLIQLALPGTFLEDARRYRDLVGAPQ